MTSQPTPGEPLNGESVRLLLPGDVLGLVHGDVECLEFRRMRKGMVDVFCGHHQANETWPVTSLYFVSRPQPSGGQDGGGVVQARNKILAVHKAFVARNGSRFIPSSEYFDAIAEALATPAKATGCPSREDVARVLAEDCVRSWTWEPDAPDDAWETEVRAQAELHLAVADAILALFPRPEDEGAA